MRRREFLSGLPLALTACGLTERPYAEQRQWPMLIRRPVVLRARANGPVLEVRGLRAGPGLESRGLQTLQADGSMRNEFYEQWAVPPAQAVEDALRIWLGQSGHFSAVVSPGSRVTADISLEGELTALWANMVTGTARAAIAVTALDVRTPASRILLTRTMDGTAVLADPKPAAAVQAQLTALADTFAQIEAALIPMTSTATRL